MQTTGYSFKQQTYRFTPSNGDTVTIPDSPSDITNIIIAPATDIATLTIAFPSTPFDGQQIRILTTKNITALTWSGGVTNRSMNSAIAAGDAKFVYDATASTYMSDGMRSSSDVALAFTASVAGGAGNAVFYATSNGLVGGTALFSSITQVQPMFDVADPLKAFSKPVVSNGNKTITTNCKISNQNIVTILTINVIGSTTLINAPDGTALTFMVHGNLN